jgi:hypothetical protein
MRKATEDVLARTEAERQIGDKLEAHGLIDSVRNEPTEVGRAVVDGFRAAEFEKTIRRVGDEDIHLRRLVITGPWEVDPNGTSK